MMNIRDLKYLVALAEHKHFGKAAKACFVSQPALSTQIKKLEQYLDVILIERNSKIFLLTDVGKQIAQAARLILLEIEHLRELGQLAKDVFQTEIKLGIIPTVAPYLLPLIMPLISKQYPQLPLFLVEAQTHVLLEKLQYGELDAAILSPIGTMREWEIVDLYPEEFLLAVHVNDELAKRKHVRQAELLNKTLLLLDDGHCLREQALDVCKLNHAKELAGFRATSLETLRYMIASGIGTTLMPKLALKKDANIVYVPFIQPKPQRQISLIFRPTSVKKTLINALATLISAAKLKM